MVGTPEEFKNKYNVSIGLVAWAVAIAFFVGRTSKAQDDLEKQVERQTKQIEVRMKEEVDGLRADWERDREEQNRRLEKLEK